MMNTASASHFTWSHILWIVTLAALVSVAVFVWPTPYTYEILPYTMHSSSGSSPSWTTLWRVNRLTGSCDWIADSRPGIGANVTQAPPPKPSDPLRQWFDEKPGK